MDIKPFFVLAYNDGDNVVSHYTQSFDTEWEARQYITKVVPSQYACTVYERHVSALPPDHHNRAELIFRNGRWGTCGGCPRDFNGFPHPERCEFTNRGDHNLKPTDR